MSVEGAFKVSKESKNLHPDLKQVIVKSVSELRKAFYILKKEILERETELNLLQNSRAGLLVKHL